MSAIDMCVPFALIFYSTDGVVVQYCVRVSFQGRTWQLTKRYSAILSFDSDVRSMLGDTLLKRMMGSSSVGLPSLSRSTIGTTNKSVRMIQKRRAVLDEYFVALSTALGTPPLSEAMLRCLLQFIGQPEDRSPFALLPESYSHIATNEVYVSAFFDVPAPIALPKVSEGDDNYGKYVGCVPRLLIALPYAIMFIDTADQLKTVLRSERAEQRPVTLHRLRELLAFYREIGTSDVLPGPDAAKSFFLEYRKRHPVQSSQSMMSNSSITRMADSLPMGSNKRPSPVRGGLPFLSPPKDAPPLADASNPLAVGPTPSRSELNASTASASEGRCSNCSHVIINSEEEGAGEESHQNDSDFACTCTDLTWCSAPDQISRYKTKASFNITVCPPTNARIPANTSHAEEDE